MVKYEHGKHTVHVPAPPNPNHPTHKQAGLIAALVSICLASAAFGVYESYDYAYTSGRESMKADVIAKMQRDHISFCRDDAPSTDPSIPQAYENYTHPQKKEEVSNISRTLAE